VEGLSIARAAAAGAADPGSVGIDFLPHSPLARPPTKGDAVILRVRGPRAGERERSLAARVEIGFPEVCRVQVSDPSLPPDEIRGLLTGTSVTLRLERDHSLVDDLYAAGTLFLSSLLTRAGDASEAASFRDSLAPRLKGAGGADGGETEALRALVSSAQFPVQGAPNPLESGPAPKGGPATLDRGLTARAVALGMRLCAAVPGGYPGQGHEPVGRSERERGYEGLLSLLTALSREVRERFLATAETGDASLAALGAYVLERLKAPQARKPGGGRGPATPGGRESR